MVSSLKGRQCGCCANTSAFFTRRTTLRVCAPSYILAHIFAGGWTSPNRGILSVNLLWTRPRRVPHDAAKTDIGAVAGAAVGRAAARARRPGHLQIHERGSRAGARPRRARRLPEAG